MTYSEAYEKALQLLNVRFLSEGELRLKLRRRDVSDDVIDEVMAMLKEEHFIDDERLARQVYAYYVRKGQYGHLYIANCLRRRQLTVPDDVERPDEYALAEALTDRKFSRHRDEARKAARYLQYRGFSPAVIAEVIASFTVSDGD
ncbi:regulatory protein RecX [uncultured Megasphaera sp.]|uniref:regulatory protein RecX n=1 Tax=uncultured Megasphaera sp. TaxID=165188 RepID=UPI0025EFC458|nr:regulatory protein RecX [uncultured Megasphaera sp.]